MKEGWEYKKLDDVCTIVGRIGFRGYTKADLVNSSKDGAITLSPSNIINGELDFSKCTYINWDKYYESPEIMLENGDIVLVKTASIGKCAVVKNLPHEATLNPQFVVLKQLVSVPDFICYYLKSSIAQNTIKQMAGGVAIPTLSQKKLGMMIVPTPSQDEQQSIVDYLDSAFAKIDAMKANAEKRINEAKALFQASLKEMLEPKEGWEYKKLGEICDFRSGFAFKSNKFTKMGEPIIRISDIQNEEIDDSSLVYFDPKSYTEDLSKYLIYPDDILIAMSGGTTGKLGINTSKRTFYLNQRVGVFRENKKYLNHRYLYYFLHTKSEESLRIAAGAAQPNLSTAQIKSFIIPAPPLSEQQSIVATLDSLKSKVDRLQANYDKISQECDALKQAILRKVFE